MFVPGTISASLGCHQFAKVLIPPNGSFKEQALAWGMTTTGAPCRPLGIEPCVDCRFADIIAQKPLLRNSGTG